MDTTQPTFTSTNPPQQQYNVFAILGFIFAFVFFPLGLIFSIIALQQLRRNPTMRGHGLASAGIIIPLIYVIIVVLYIVSLLRNVRSSIVESQAQDTKIVSDIKQFQTVLERYRGEHGTYPYAENNIFFLGRLYKLCENGFVSPEKVCTITYADHIPTNGVLRYNTDAARATYSIQFYLSQPRDNLSTTNCARPNSITSGACPNTWQNQPGE